MKKLIVFFTVAVAATMLTGCEPFSTYYFKIKNDTAYDIIVEVDGRNPIIINPNDSKTVCELSGAGIPGDPYSLEDNMADYDVKINNILMSKSIWQRKYWEHQSNSKYHITYTLVVTEELLETLSSENNPNS